MGKIVSIGEAIIVIKELWDTTSNFFRDAIPNNFYEILDKLAFLDSNILGINSSGSFTDGTQKMAEAISNLSSLFIWGLLLFYGFRCLFSYFISKKVDVPWKMFIRMIVFGILANASFFICYTGVYFTENCTNYIRTYVGENNMSFSFIEDYVEEGDLTESEEGENIYTLDALSSIFTYFSSFFVAVCLGARFIFIKFLMLSAPIFFAFGTLKSSEKIFFFWCEKYFLLLGMQIFFIIILGIGNLCSNNLFSQILICGLLFLMCKNISSNLLLQLRK